MLLYFSLMIVCNGKCFFIVLASSGLRNYKLNVRKNYLGCRFTYVTTTEGAEEDPVVGVPTDH